MDKFTQKFIEIDKFFTEFSMNNYKNIVINVRSYASAEIKRSALLKIEFLNKNNEPVENPEWPSVSKAVGDYKYLRVRFKSL